MVNDIVWALIGGSVAMSGVTIYFMIVTIVMYRRAKARTRRRRCE